LGQKRTQIEHQHYFKTHYMLIGKHIFVIFLSLFIIRNFRGTCSSMPKGVHGQRKFGNPWTRVSSYLLWVKSSHSV